MNKHQKPEVFGLQRKYCSHGSDMLREGFINDQFTKLINEVGALFLEELVKMFYDQSEKHLNGMSRALEQKPVDFKQLDYDHVHPLKGSSVSIGAGRVANVCINFKSFCEAQNLEGCKRCLQQLNYECYHLKDKLQYFFELQQEIRDGGGNIPKIWT